MTAQVPTIDITRFEHDKAGFVEQLGQAYAEFGFCGIRNHGIDEDLMDRAYRAFQRFFALPAEVKQRYHVPGLGGARGYTGFGVEVAKDSEHPDLKEFWQIGRDLPEDHPQRHRVPGNVWPSEVTEFRDSAQALYHALDHLGRRVLRAMALYLNIDEDYFEQTTREGNSILRAIHYPPVDADPRGSIRAGQHEDINLITLLIGSHQSGLELLSRSGQWVPVTTVPGAIMCNIGDMMQRLTNHVFPSTTHRVVNPPGEDLRKPRYSIPFFLHPNADFVIRTLPTCISTDNPDRYPEPLESHAWLQQRLEEIGLLPGKRNG